MEFTVTKYAAQITVATELLFDNLGPRQGLTVDGIQFFAPWSPAMVKEWLRTGHGLGRTKIACRWPRPTRLQLREERIAYNEWLNSLDEDDEDD